MQSGMLVVLCMISTFNCMPGISASMFSLRFVWKASLLWINLVQACIWPWLYIGVFCVEFIAISGIVLLHLFWILLLVVCDLWLYSPYLQSSNYGISLGCIAYLVFCFLCCFVFFHAWQGFAHECNWSEYAIVQCFIPGATYTASCL